MQKTAKRSNLNLLLMGSIHAPGRIDRIDGVTIKLRALCGSLLPTVTHEDRDFVVQMEIYRLHSYESGNP